MDRFWKEIALAAVIGMVLPWLLLLICAKELLIRENVSKPQSLPAETVQEETLFSTDTSQIQICVQLSDSAVRTMELEEYLVCVVLAEMPATFQPEALKAQAIVARTYALKRLEEGDRHTYAAVCTDPKCCQAYITQEAYLADRGTQEDVEKIRAAVEQTTSVVLTYQNELIEATYFSCSGGRTEDAVAVWGTEIPYLQAVDSPGEEYAEVFCSSAYFTAEEFAKALGRRLTGKPSEWLGAATYTEGGGVDTMLIGGMQYSGTELRRLLELNSTAFQMIPGQHGITVESVGRGHRVGMSQYGANAMAQKGSSYRQILTYYYQGVVIDKAENMG